MELKFLLSYVLILIALYYSYKEKLGVERQLIYSSIRAFVQLLALGYILHYIFKIENSVGLFLILFVMVLFASWTAQRRVNLIKNGYLKAFVSIGLSSFLVLISLVAISVISLKANELIPVGGMIIGNSLNVYTLTVDRFKGEIASKIDIIENIVALGATLKQAIYFMKKQSVKSALIPTINSLQTVGIIHIPGITTGMLLAGANPIQAVSYQLVIMYMMVAVALFTAVITINFVYKTVFETAVFQRSL
jgi:putative ABC transport system permease protein